MAQLNDLALEYYTKALAGEIPGGTLPQSSQDVLDRLTYNAELDQLEASVPLQTTLNTFWLSDQWGISSGNASMFFSSTDQEIDFTPVMQGAKSQYHLANQDHTGIIHPFNRMYSTDLLTASLKGTEATTGSAEYSGVSNVTDNIAVFGVTSTLAESLKEGDKLTYRLHKGVDSSGTVIFKQTIPVTADREPGFKFTGWWKQPAEGFAGDVVFAEITVTPKEDPEAQRVLLVRPTVEDANVHWNELHYRVFEDVRIPNFYEMRNGNLSTQTRRVLTMAQLLALAGMEEGDRVRVAYDPTTNGNGDVTSFTESSMYVYESGGWRRDSKPEVLERSANFTARDGDTYYIMRPAGVNAINITIDDTVKEFMINDGDGNTSGTRFTNVILGVDNVKITRPGNFRFYREGNTFNVFEGEEKMAEVNV